MHFWFNNIFQLKMGLLGYKLRTILYTYIKSSCCTLNLYDVVHQLYLYAKETQMYRTDFWTLRERERVGWFGRMALKHVYYHVRNESPVYVQCRIQDAWGWCTGMIQRDDIGWEVGWGFRIGNSCRSVADSCQCMAKPIQYCRVK